MTFYTRIDSPFGALILAGDGQALSHLHFADQPGLRPSPLAADWQERPELFTEAAAQLHDYFEGRREVFTLPLRPQGTAFQQRVWQQLCEIPYGTVISYAELARALGLVNGARAVGTANGKNPLPLIIPCHRVVAANGRLAGYAYGEECKRRLLRLEGVERWGE